MVEAASLDASRLIGMHQLLPSSVVDSLSRNDWLVGRCNVNQILRHVGAAARRLRAGRPTNAMVVFSGAPSGGAGFIGGGCAGRGGTSCWRRHDLGGILSGDGSEHAVHGALEVLDDAACPLYMTASASRPVGHHNSVMGSPVSSMTPRQM